MPIRLNLLAEAQALEESRRRDPVKRAVWAGVFLVLALAWPRARLVGLGALILLTGWTNHTLRTAVLSPHDLRRILGEPPQIVTLRGMLRETPFTALQ